jgi:RHH-type proline utilization regulon transcriptional repressor/proline dehydrogenase/delta 1-pyrroline-5-carboxylate dehydrogenase
MPSAASLPDPKFMERVIALARELQARATELQTLAERRQQAELDRMLQSPQDKATLLQMTDQAFRSSTPHRAADQLVHILDVQGVPRFFSPIDRTLLKGFQSFGDYAPGVAVPLVKAHMRKETANVILPAEPDMLRHHLRERRDEGVRMNVNYLGEAILGEDEANRRLQAYLQALQWPETEVVSIKISTLFSQISTVARAHTVATVCARLERLCRTAARASFTRGDGTHVPKFVYLDMEEYRDMQLTAEVFIRTLERKGMANVSAGIALQAYLPDSFRTQQQLNEWARARVAHGGAPVTLRLVKGANLEMERLEAALKNWPQAPYKTKLETDANYKRMVQEGMKRENLAAVRLGIASHNLFDLAYAFVLASDSHGLDKVQFEMLEGMANHQRRALFERSRDLLLYAPICRKEQFLSAIGYLFRRLDENTGPDNFLRHAFKLKVGSPEWERLEQGFRDSYAASFSVSNAPRRTQNRMTPLGEEPRAEMRWWKERIPRKNPRPSSFVNEPDTDFSLPHNSAWAQQIVERWQPRCGDGAVAVPLVIDGAEVSQDEEWRGVAPCLDPSRPGVVVGRYHPASEANVVCALTCARADPDGWRSLTVEERTAILGRVAQGLRRARGDLIGAALANGGKTITESDTEVSEAVDFLECYRSAAHYFSEREGRGKGVVVVVSPWNFPIAIPCGGITAALAAGNTVILKPASDTVLVAWELCQCFWRGGVSKRALQFLPCSGGGPGRQLVSHPSVDAVILTGGTETALAMLGSAPKMRLFAETGGKNATIVTALADRDQAIKHVVHSAFSHSGQKCSATSLLLLEKEIYDDSHFQQALCDAVQSLQVGSAWELDTKIGPLIRPPSGDLENALKVLEPGESWAVMPRPSEHNPNLWSPGVKWGVSRGSYTHQTEFFGPVLGVMRFEKLADAIAQVNQTGYGLTSGLESLDDREQEIWQAGIRAGNLYINRPTTGAVVLRQPFGGMGKSCFGPGLKAGGPNYVAQFMHFEDKPLAAPLSVEPLANEQLTTLREHLQELSRTAGTPPASRARTRGLKRRSTPAVAAKREASASKPPATPEEIARLLAALASYDRYAHDEFAVAHDHFHLLGQDNLRRYLPIRELRLRLHPEDTAFELFARVAAARSVGSRITVSAPREFESAALTLLGQWTEAWAGGIEFVEESDDELAEVIRQRQTDRVRYAAPDRVPDLIRTTAATAGFYIADAPVLSDGRVELLWYVQEQSVSFDYHRYGNLGIRATEERAPVL